jgi:C_GCAxxG_C_C family probable redox protein
MTPDKFTQAKDAALEGFRTSGSGHLNCAQSVLRFSLSVMDGDADLILAARYFGGGIAGMGRICGALAGAAMALGLRDYLHRGLDAEATPTVEPLQNLMRAFEAEFGATECAILTGHDMSAPGGHDRAKEAGALERCPLFVSWVCDHVLPMLGE